MLRTPGMRDRLTELAPTGDAVDPPANAPVIAR